jgi:archaellum biogenesis ATPase FlaH
MSKDVDIKSLGSPESILKSKTISIEEKERILLTQLLKNEEVFIKTIPFIKPDYFEGNINRIIANYMIEYYEEYKVVPKKEELLALVDVEIPYDYLDTDYEWNSEFLKDFVNEFIKNMSVKKAIEESIELLEKGDYGLIEKKIKEAVEIDIDVSLGTSIGEDISEDVELISTILEEKEQVLPTGWANLDMALYGGVNVPSMNIIVAKSGGGKSVALTNLADLYRRMGHDVVYISLELKEQKIIKRFLSVATNIPQYELKNRLPEIKMKMKEWKEKGYGKFTVQFFNPNTLNALKLELYIRNYVARYKKVPIIIVDYIDLMTPNRRNWQGLFEKDKFVSEELRGVAMMFDTIVWTATQFNRCVDVNSMVRTKNGMKKIKDIEIGEYVLGSNNEWRIVKNKSNIEKQKVYKIKTKNGKELIVSGRHLIPVIVNGKIKYKSVFNSLEKGDKVIVKNK